MILEDEVLHHHDDFKYKVVGVLQKNGSVLDNIILTPIETVWIMHAGHNEDSEYTIGHSKKTKTKDVGHLHHDHGDSHNHHDHEVHNHKELSVDEILSKIKSKDKEVTAILFPKLEGSAHVGVLNNANNQPGMMAVDPAPEIALLKSKLSPFISIVVGIAYYIDKIRKKVDKIESRLDNDR